MTEAPELEMPRLTETERGVWLAVSPLHDHPLVGVEAATRDEAIRRYRVTRAEWRAILNAPESKGPAAVDGA